MSISTSPPSLAFGAQQINEGESLTVTLTNSGESAVSVAAGTGTFAWSAGTVPAKSGETDGALTVTVTFCPTSTGAKSGSLAAGSATVGLSGEGVDAAIGQVAETDMQQASGSSAATLNRYRIEIPTFNTNFVMGRGSELSGKETRHGFGLRTDKHFFVRTGANIVMQSLGDTLIQSNPSGDVSDDNPGSLYALAKGNAVVAGAVSANLISPGGTLISGGFGSLSLEDSDGTRDVANLTDGSDGVDTLLDNRNLAAAVVSGFDALVAASAAVYGGVGTVRTAIDTAGKPSKGTGIAATVAGITGVLVGAAGSVLSTMGAIPGASPVSGTTIFGASGVVLGSTGFSGFYSLAGLVNVSVYPMTLGVDPLILGMKSIALHAVSSLDAMAGRKAHLHGRTSTRVTSGEGVVAMGTVKIDAGTILIGQDADVPVTTEITLDASGGAAPGTNSLQLKNDGTLSIETLTKVEITVGGHTIKVEPTGISIEDAAGNGMALSASELTAQHNTLAKLACGSNYFHADAIGLILKGSKLNIN